MTQLPREVKDIVRNDFDFVTMATGIGILIDR